MSKITISLLGPLQVSLDGETVSRFESLKVRALRLASEAKLPEA